MSATAENNDSTVFEPATQEDPHLSTAQEADDEEEAKYELARQLDGFEEEDNGGNPSTPMGPKRSRDDSDSGEGSPSAKRGPAYVFDTEPVFDLGPNAFERYGIKYIINKAVSADVVHYSENKERVKEVVFKVEDASRLDGDRADAALRAAWHEHAAEWPERRKAVFRGAVARALAVLVDAAYEVSQPGYAMIVLKQLMPAAITNRLKNPHAGGDDTHVDDSKTWFARDQQIWTFLHELDGRIAEHNAKELARMHNSRRMGRGAIDRKGKAWKDFVPYIREARKPAEGVMDLAKAMLAYYVYDVQIDAWGHSISGPKDELRTEVLGLEREFREQFKVEYGHRLV